MFSRFKDFLSRHKRKFIVTGVIVGGTALAINYAQRKLREYQENQAREYLEKIKKTQHFESMERLCNQTIIGFAPNIWDVICKQLDTDAILQKIRQHPDNKHELWNELKIIAFTRLTTMVYAYSMMVIVYRVQINLLGGYLYKDTVNGDGLYQINTQERYLSFGHHILTDGITDLIKLIEKHVRDVVKNYNLSDKLTLSATEQIFWSIQMLINSDQLDPNSNFAKYVFPKASDELIKYSECDLTIMKLYTDTLDIFESDEIASLCTNNVSRGFSIVIDNIADYYSEYGCGLVQSTSDGSTSTIVSKSNGKFPTKLTATENGKTILQNGGGSSIASTTSMSDLNEIININNIEIPIPKLIPIIVGLAAKPFNYNGRPPSLSTSLVTLYLLSDKIKLLGANIYELFCQ